MAMEKEGAGPEIAGAQKKSELADALDNVKRVEILAKDSVEIPLVTFADIYGRLCQLFQSYNNPGKVVIIGGRGVNLHCYGKSRKTFDIDGIIKIDVERTERLPEIQYRERLLAHFEPIADYYGFTLNWSSAFESKFTIVDKKSGIKTDLFLLNEHRPQSAVSKAQFKAGKIDELPLKDILDCAVGKRENIGDLGDMTIYVASRPQLVMMKLMTWIDRGSRTSPKHKDGNDIIDLLINHYSGSVDEFVNSLSEKIKEDSEEAKILKRDLELTVKRIKGRKMLNEGYPAESIAEILDRYNPNYFEELKLELNSMVLAIKSDEIGEILRPIENIEQQ